MREGDSLGSGRTGYWNDWSGSTLFSHFFPLAHGAYNIVQHLDPWTTQHLLEYDFVHLAWVIHPLDKYFVSVTHELYNIYTL